MPWLSPKDMKRHRLRDTLDHISMLAAERYSRVMPAGTLFVVVRGMVLAKDLPVALAQVPMAFNQDIKALVPRDGIDPEFLLYAVLASKDAMATEIGTTAHGTRRIGSASIDSLVVPLPGNDEQRCIAAVLSRIERAVDAEKKRLATLNELKAATMAKVFREGLRGEPLKETEIGEIPESWSLEELGRLCAPPEGAIQTGPFGSQLHSSDYVGGGIPIVNPTHIDEGRVVERGIPCVKASDAERLGRHRLRVGDILFSRRGDVGRHAYISAREQGFLCGTGCLLVRPRPFDIHAAFLSYALDTPAAQGYLREHATGTIMPNINTRILAGVPIPVGSRPEQEAIAAMLANMDERASAARARHQLLDELFHSSLHQLMTGQLRVTPLLEQEVADAAG